MGIDQKYHKSKYSSYKELLVTKFWYTDIFEITQKDLRVETLKLFSGEIAHKINCYNQGRGRRKNLKISIKKLYHYMCVLEIVGRIFSKKCQLY